tara:strand:- start:2666 stop:5893 length:3228 start_codon:yes stop_codon:yes gene_type:complete
MAVNMYSQTPNAIHMGGGYSHLGAYQDALLGNVFGHSQFGNTMGGFATAMPGHMLNIGTAASIASGMGIGGAGTRMLGNTLGLGSMGFAASIPAHLALMTAASRFRAGHQQQMFAQNALQSVIGERNMGGNFGFGASRGAARGFANMFQELSSSAEILTNDNELKAIFNKLNDMSLFQTVRSASEVGARFKKLVTTVRDISRDLGTTLEGVMPMFQRHVQMGFIDPDEIRTSMRTNRALRGVGIGTSDATITGLEMAQSASNFAAGGTRKMGALGAQRNLAMVNVALEQGIITDEDLINSTGQIGEKGAADLAQQFMQASRNVLTSRSGYGDLLTAFLGETDKEGKFTGKIDKGALGRLGNMSYEDLAEIAGDKLNRGAMSFEAKMHSGMGADIASQLSGGDVGRVFDMIFQNEDADSEEAMHILMKGITGQRGQTIDVMLKLMGQQQGVMQEVARQVVEKSIRNRLPSLIEERFAISGRLNRMYREYIDQPLTEINKFGSSASSSVGRYMDNITRQTLTSGLGGFTKSIFGYGMGTQNTRESINSARSFLADEYMGQDNMGEAYDPYGSGTGGALGMGAIGYGLTHVGLGMSSTGPGALAGIPLAALGGVLMYSAGSDIATNLRGDLTREEAFDSVSNENYNSASGSEIMAILEREKFNSTLRDSTKKELINNLRLAHAQGKTGADLVSDTFSMDHSSRFGSISPIYMQDGGRYGTAMALSQDKSLTEAERNSFKKLARDMRETTLTEAGMAQNEYSTRTLEELSKEMDSRLESDSGGLRNEFFGSQYDQIENVALAEMWANGESHKLVQVMQLLMNGDKLGDLFDSGKDMNGKELKQLFLASGIDLTEGQALSIFELIKDSVREAEGDKNVAASYIAQTGRDVVKIARSRATITRRNKTRIAARKAAESGASSIATALTSIAEGDIGKARKRIENLFREGNEKKAREELQKLDPVTRTSIQRYLDLVGAGDDEEFRDRMGELFKGTSIDVDNMSIDDLQNLALENAVATSQYVEEDAALSASMRLGDAEGISKIITEVNKVILNQLGASQKVTDQYVTNVTDAITRLNDRIPR